MILLSPDRRTEQEMLVMESAGGPRGGKGTITKHLGSSYPGARTDETGLDYRAVTLGLLESGRLEEDMDAVAVASIVNAMEGDEITDLAAKRYELVASFGEKALHDPRVSRIVGKVSPHPHVRKAVKSGFIIRVEQQIEIGTPILVVDGRNLQKVLSGIEGLRIVLRYFVDCEVPVAVVREAKRQKIDLDDPVNQAWFDMTFDSIMGRRTEDETRDDDRAVPDLDRINYWYNTAVRVATAEQYALRHGLSVSQAMYFLTQPENMRVGGRTGAGALAYRTGRQVYFDTSEILEDPMKELAKRMADEALDAHAEANRSRLHLA